LIGGEGHVVADLAEPAGGQFDLESTLERFG
jgi:hypothetical protein